MYVWHVHMRVFELTFLELRRIVSATCSHLLVRSELFNR